MKKAVKIVGIGAGVLLLLAVLLILTLTVTEYRPADREVLQIDQGTETKTLAPGAELNVVSWNVGYGALGDNADFFMDGGKMVQSADQNRVTENLLGIRSTLTELQPDLCFLQEVDINSDRSWHTDERSVLAAALPGASSVFAPNYRVLYVPYPLPPIGHVDAGLLTLSSLPLSSAERIQLPCPFSWPVRLGQLKRCLLVSRLPLEGTDKELVAVNFHLEAYDDGSGKAAQTEMLADFLTAEVEKGNYVIAGGDFNQVISGMDPAWQQARAGLWMPGVLDVSEFGDVLSAIMPDNGPTCRSLDQPLAGADLSTFQFYLIDGFIVSNNVQVNLLETDDRGFICADHNPVRLQVTLMP